MLKNACKSRSIPLSLTLASLFCLLITAAAQADSARALRLKSAELGCGGAHSPGSTSTYPMRNFDNSNTIEITGVRIYDANGMLVYHAPSSDSFPANFKSVLGPQQSTFIRTNDLFPDSALTNPIQTIVNWRTQGNDRAVALRVGVVRIVTGSGRHNGSCRILTAND